MTWDVAGIGNALVDALVTIEDETVLDELGLVRGTMHPVGHEQWMSAYELLRHHKVTFDSGGSCANTIAMVGQLGGRATYFGQVGDDQLGKMYGQKMEEACGSHALQFAEAQPTGKCLSIISAKDAERTMLTDLGISTNLPSLEPFRSALVSSRIAHFTGYTLLGGPVKETVLEAMESAKQAGVSVSLDVADPFVVHETREIMWEVIRDYVDILFLNAEEARSLTELSPEESLHFIAKKGEVKTVVVKLGGRGSLVLHDGELYSVDVRRVRALDTTGAGDAYAGGFLSGLVHGLDMQRCGDLASAVAALTVAQIGAVVKNRDALNAVVREFGIENAA